MKVLLFPAWYYLIHVVTQISVSYNKNFFTDFSSYRLYNDPLNSLRVTSKYGKTVFRN